MAMPKKEEIETLLTRSKRFFETAGYQTSVGYYDLAMFSLEQALQLFLKARLLENGVDYPHTHSVTSLLEMLGNVSRGKEQVVRTLLEKHLTVLGLLEDAYITSRHVPREYRREEVKRVTKSVRELMENV